MQKIPRTHHTLTEKVATDRRLLVNCSLQLITMSSQIITCMSLKTKKSSFRTFFFRLQFYKSQWDHLSATCQPVTLASVYTICLHNSISEIPCSSVLDSLQTFNVPLKVWRPNLDGKFHMWSYRALIQYRITFFIHVFKLPTNHTQNFHCSFCCFCTLGRHSEIISNHYSQISIVHGTHGQWYERYVVRTVYGTNRLYMDE